jgi:hypothetical protein
VAWGHPLGRALGSRRKPRKKFSTKIQFFLDFIGRDGVKPGVESENVPWGMKIVIDHETQL